MPAAFFSSLDLLPLRPDGIDGPCFSFAEDVRVTADQFIDDMAANFLEIERAAFLGQLTMKDDLQEHVAQFLHHFKIVPRLDGIDQLINLFHGVKTQAQVVLLTIPRTACRGTQPGHDTQ